MHLLFEDFQIIFGLEIAYKQFMECNQTDMISHTQYCQYTRLKDYTFLRVLLLFMCCLFACSYVCLKDSYFLCLAIRDKKVCLWFLVFWSQYICSTRSTDLKIIKYLFLLLCCAPGNEPNAQTSPCVPG